MRKRREFVRPEGLKSARLIVIAAEGRNTENIYFEAMKVSMCDPSVHVEVLHRDDDDSSPENVYGQIRDFMSEYNITAASPSLSSATLASSSSLA